MCINIMAELLKGMIATTGVIFTHIERITAISDPQLKPPCSSLSFNNQKNKQRNKQKHDFHRYLGLRVLSEVISQVSRVEWFMGEGGKAVTITIFNIA